ncbi:16S rRNA (cytidine(1402)-2'-O)-methyltransferase [Allochromatium palmeri]|uniref:Ribosomal RNA small subunit methyltransferase I n=1 Tax=Allochromatium palmeri TaxID=231048 RepID=A0A6N8EEE0_9GAMM|nr:16S rRNA (cytidine(1402)-2'-O)-methyltransferase [Allochromatium palmeri]MTW22011.1 16S rRNA (cytidine(1402)-2'-O)-methyltransferase [Allochromatium palmeri]
MQRQAGVLYVVATPIGNLGDLSARARQVLAEVDSIAAEDTRETRRLLAHCGISAELIAYHDHNESELTPRLLEALESGQRLALVSDAGTPLISDPGYTLVAAARERGLNVVPIPGASAAICALSASGLPSDRFLFLGFPPRTQSRRRAWIESVAREPGTLILYESAKRALETLRDLQAVLGDGRRCVIARELTKHFETFLLGPASELIMRLESDAEQRLGEMVILVEGCPESETDASRNESIRVLRLLCEAMPLSQATAVAARLTGAKKNALYRLGLELNLGAESS